jgi:hypothetical protein
MFCTTKKTMLCIKCFRDTSAEDRLHCVDLDTAYNQGAKKLERALAVSWFFILRIDAISVSAIKPFKTTKYYRHK